MTRRNDGRPFPSERIAAYRDAAIAEADAHFDERALDAQRQRILQRLAHLGQTARVLRFPGGARTETPTLRAPRGWISVAAAAGLVVGLVGGQMLHPRVAGWRGGAPGALDQRMPSRAAHAELAVDDGLLQEIEQAVQLRSATELRALDELTPFREPR